MNVDSEGIVDGDGRVKRVGSRLFGSQKGSAVFFWKERVERVEGEGGSEDILLWGVYCTVEKYSTLETLWDYVTWDQICTKGVGLV
jgi:hypothetical protein